MIRRNTVSLASLALAALLVAPCSAPAATREDPEESITIVHGEVRTVYEYRQNGILRMIKVVPKKGRPYYLVPPEGSAPFEGLAHTRKLYPQWVILQW